MRDDKTHNEDDRHFALSDDGSLVYLGHDSSTKIPRKDYTCLGCGEILRPVQGEQREWHFRHKINAQCNKESYIHKLGKIVIRNRFYNEESFIIKYNTQSCCINYDSCPLSSHKCRHSELCSFDLKEFYDTCQEEKSCDSNYRADLLLTHSQHPDRKPVYIEIAYKNECGSAKIDSGTKIIEIKVEEEGDLCKPLEEPKYHQFCVNFDSPGSPYKAYPPPIRFFNFERRMPHDNTFSINVDLYVVVNENGILKPVHHPTNCSVMKAEPSPQFVYMLCTQRGRLTGKGEFYLFSYLMAVNKGVNIRNCITCERYYTGGCNRNKSDDTDPYALASNCPNYILDNRRVHDLIRQYNFNDVDYWYWKK